METRDPSDIDRNVSEPILARRNTLGMSQPPLSERVGASFQQVQKYENGKNRVSAGRPYEIAKALGVTLPYFYERARPAWRWCAGAGRRNRPGSPVLTRAKSLNCWGRFAAYRRLAPGRR